MTDPRPHRFIPDLRSIWRYLKDPDSDWKPKAAAALAVLYLVWPLDLVPDVAPIIGWLDDLGVAALAVAYLASASKGFPTPRK